jgi:hypothetical protein
MKRQLGELSEYLDAEVDAGRLTENTYVGACKRLKAVFDAGEAPKKMIIQDVVVEYALTCPSSLASAPAEISVYDNDFIEYLLEAFDERMENESDRRAWIAELLEFYFQPQDFDDDAIPIDVTRELICVIVEQLPSAAEQLMDHLVKTLGIAPLELLDFETLSQIAIYAPVVLKYYFKDGACIGEASDWLSPTQTSILQFICKRRATPDVLTDRLYCRALGLPRPVAAR